MVVTVSHSNYNFLNVSNLSNDIYVAIHNCLTQVEI